MTNEIIPKQARVGITSVARVAQTYRNIAYLMLGLPLGIAYFVFLVTGFSLGAGLAVTLAGIPVLLLVLIGSRVLCTFERQVSDKVLGVHIPEPSDLLEHVLQSLRH